MLWVYWPVSYSWRAFQLCGELTKWSTVKESKRRSRFPTDGPAIGRGKEPETMSSNRRDFLKRFAAGTIIAPLGATEIVGELIKPADVKLIEPTILQPVIGKVKSLSVVIETDTGAKITVPIDMATALIKPSPKTGELYKGQPIGVFVGLHSLDSSPGYTMLRAQGEGVAY